MGPTQELQIILTQLQEQAQVGCGGHHAYSSQQGQLPIYAAKDISNF